MKTIYQCLVSLLLIASSHFYVGAQTPSIIWQTSSGGSDYEGAYSLDVTNDGGYVTVAETFSSDGDIGNFNGGSDYWLVKYDSAGIIQWEKAYGGTSNDIPACIRQTADNGYIMAGKTYSNNGDVSGNHYPGRFDYWIVKTDSAGIMQWQKCFGGSFSDEASAIEQTSDGGYIITGSTNSADGDVIGNHGAHDFWVIKINAAGDIIWSQCLGGAYNDFSSCIKQTTDKGFIVAGTSAGNVPVNHGNDDYRVYKLDSLGNFQWHSVLGGSQFEVATSIQQNFHGEYIIAGYSNSNDSYVSNNHGNNDYWIVKLNALGKIIWEYSFGGSGDDRAYSLDLNGDGGYIIAGSSASIDGDITNHHTGTSINSDFWIVKINNDGALVWQTSIGGTETDNAYSIRQTADYGYAICGESNSVNGDISGNHGVLDCIIMKLSPELQNFPMAGVYNIGGTNPDFISMHAAMSACMDNGINGNVYFKIRAGSYSEHVEIPFINGSGVYSINFESETGFAGSVTIDNANSNALENWILKLSGSVNINFKNLTFNTTKSLYSRAVLITDLSNHIRFSGCRFNAPVSTNNSIEKSIITSIGFYGNNNLDFIGNTFNNGSYGIYDECTGYIYSLSKLVINNTFNNQYAGGIYWYRVMNSEINGNTILTNSILTDYKGVYGQLVGDVILSANKIYRSTGTGIHLINGIYTIKNNFVHVQGTSQGYGIRVEDSNGENCRIYNNSVHITNINAQSSALFVSSGSSGKFLIYNNILINEGGGYAIHVIPVTNIEKIDYNLIYSTGQYIGRWNGTNCQTLSDWQSVSGFDSLSHSHNVLFVSIYDLHIRSTPFSLNYGLPLPEVTTDIDGTVRNPVSPAVGGVEIKFCTPPSMPGPISQSGQPKVCPGDVRTYATDFVADVTYDWTVPVGASIISGQGTHSIGVIFYDDLDPQDFVSVVKRDSCGSSGMQSRYVLRNIPTIPSSISGPAYGVCGLQNVVYSVQPVSGLTYHWVVPAQAQIISGQGTHSITVNFQTEIFCSPITVTATNACGRSNIRSAIIRSAPQTPGNITGEHIICPNISGYTYSINPVFSAQVYTWFAPTGSHITANGITSPANTITTTATSVVINFGAINSSSLVKVRAMNSCDYGGVQTFQLSPLNIPIIPSAISGPAYGVCGLQNVVYSVQPVSDMTYNWVVPAQAQIISGQGTNSITVNFQVAIFCSPITVTATNTCGSGNIRSAIIRSAPQTPGNITGEHIICPNISGYTYSINPVFSAQAYTWFAPTGSHITANGITSPLNTLTTTATSVVINFGAISSSSLVKVRAMNSCDYGGVQTFQLSPCTSRLSGASTISLNTFPNPFNDKITIELSTEMTGTYDITVFDLTGRAVKQQNYMLLEGNNTISLEMTNLKPGEYLLEIKSTNQRQYTRIMKL